MSVIADSTSSTGKLGESECGDGSADSERGPGATSCGEGDRDRDGDNETDIEADADREADIEREAAEWKKDGSAGGECMGEMEVWWNGRRVAARDW